jgi:hypothetical protein
MTGNTTVSVEVGGHDLEIAIHENYFELKVGILSDSKENVVNRGPWKKNDDLNEPIRHAIKARCVVPIMWRKCKTVLKIKSRCNEDVWNTAQEPDDEKNRSISCRVATNGIRFYPASLCPAHMPVATGFCEDIDLPRMIIFRTRCRRGIFRFGESNTVQKACGHASFLTEAQKAVDTGRWTFNWFEIISNGTRSGRKRLRSGDLVVISTVGIFRSTTTPDGVVISVYPHSDDGLVRIIGH